MIRGLIVAITASLLLAACEKTVETPLGSDYSHPFLESISVSPEGFNTDTILVNGQINPQDLITISFVCSAAVANAMNLPAANVSYRITRPVDDTFYGSGLLRDDGISPDITANDGVYTDSIEFSIPRIEGGFFELSVTAVMENGNSSNTLKQRIPIFRSSRAPFLYDLSAPDSVILPPPGFVSLIFISIAASDSDGPGDIDQVFFRNLDSPSDTMRRFPMYDDGDVNGVSGDSTANDGLYSITVQLPSTTPVGTYRFLFEATDRFGLMSNAILHPLTILPNE